MLMRAQSCLTILMKSFDQRELGKIFEGKMLIRTLPTTFLQIFCEENLDFQVIVKSNMDPDDNF